MFLSLPWSLGLWVGLMVLVQAVRSLLPETAETAFVLSLALVPARYAGAAADLPGGVVASYTSPLTHMFVHGDWSHLLLNATAMLAYGGLLARRLGNVRFCVFSLLCGLAGSAVFLALHRGEAVALVGASGAVSGVLAGALRLVAAAMTLPDLRRALSSPASLGFGSLASTLTSRFVLIQIGIFLGLNLVVGAFGETLTGGAPVAWEAHIGGFLAGLLGVGYLAGPPRPPEAREPLPMGGASA